MTPADVSAVVCTRNSISGIERCLTSLRRAGVCRIIVVDADSTDGTREVAGRLADTVVTDMGTGLGNARNTGIALTTSALILNMGSDNVMPPGQLERMIATLAEGGFQGVSARTVIEGDDYFSRGLNAWRSGRFRPGPSAVIGTPTLFDGSMLRSHPYDPVRVLGKTSWNEVRIRCRMYGISDEEVMRIGRSNGWSLARQAQSLTHPLRVDFVTPIRNLPIHEAVTSAPFLAGFAALRYYYWIRTAIQR